MTRRVGYGCLLLAVGMMPACGDDAERSTGPAQERGRESASGGEPAGDGRPTLYGAQDELLASDEDVAGLTLPRGLEVHRKADRRHVYYTHVPLDKVQKYFGPRLITGQVERVGDGAIYRAAVPRDVSGGVVKLDVSILPTRRGTRVEIREIRPAAKRPPPRADTARRLRQKRKRLE